MSKYGRDRKRVFNHDQAIISLPNCVIEFGPIGRQDYLENSDCATASDVFAPILLRVRLGQEQFSPLRRATPST
jgi:hypothetical protein